MHTLKIQMRLSEPIWIVATVIAFLLIVILVVMWVIYRRRSRIIKMGWLVNGTVLEIIERRGFKGNTYRMYVIEYSHHLRGQTIVQEFSAKNPQTMKKGNVVPLYYHPEKPHLVVLKNDNHTRFSLIVLTILAILVLTAGIYCIRFLLFETYRS